MLSPHSRDKMWRRKTVPDPTQLLRECCKHHASAIVLTIKKNKVCCHAGLISISGDTLTLGLNQEPVRIPVKGTDCCLSFNDQNETHAIFGEVLDYSHKPPPENSELVLKLRSGIVGMELAWPIA
jgi:hypothetical protein